MKSLAAKVALARKAAAGVAAAKKELLAADVAPGRQAELLDDLRFFASVGAKASRSASAMVLDMRKRVWTWRRKANAAY
jgi:hypothetical protein